MTDSAQSEYVVLRRSDAEALIEEWAIDEDPFWRPIDGVTVSLPSCSCGSISLYNEDPPRMGPRTIRRPVDVGFRHKKHAVKPVPPMAAERSYKTAEASVFDASPSPVNEPSPTGDLA